MSKRAATPRNSPKAISLTIAVVMLGLCSVSYSSQRVRHWANMARLGTQSSALADKATKPSPDTSEAAPEEIEQLRETVKRQRAEIDKLRNRVAKLKERLQPEAIRDRLTQEEQRGQNLNAELFSIAEREAGLQSRLDDANEQLRPENINNLPIYGSTHPEEVRESTRRRLTNEVQRIQSQLDLLSQSKMRVQSSLTATDLKIQDLQGQLQNASARP